MPNKKEQRLSSTADKSARLPGDDIPVKNIRKAKKAGRKLLRPAAYTYDDFPTSELSVFTA